MRPTPDGYGPAWACEVAERAMESESVAPEQPFQAVHELAAEYGAKNTEGQEEACW
jgi:hypothetical protein